MKPPFSRCGTPVANSMFSSPRATSPIASDSTLPCCSVITAGDIGAMLVDRLADAEHQVGTLRQRRAPPRHERLARRLDGLVDLLDAREIDLVRLLAGGRVVHGAGPTALPEHELAADPVAQAFHRYQLPQVVSAGLDGIEAGCFVACRTSARCLRRHLGCAPGGKGPSSATSRRGLAVVNGRGNDGAVRLGLERRTEPQGVPAVDGGRRRHGRARRMPEGRAVGWRRRLERRRRARSRRSPRRPASSRSTNGPATRRNGSGVTTRRPAIPIPPSASSRTPRA